MAESSQGLAGNLGEAGLLEFSAESVKQFGGVKGVVQKLWDTFNDPETTANVKRQILLNILENARKASDMMKDSNEVKKMSTDELTEFALKLMGDHGGNLPWLKKKLLNGIPQRETQGQ